MSSKLQCTYLLTPLEARVSGRCSYVGYTVNPPRRLRQHNGELVSGAKRTKRLAPWRFVCVVMGFPSSFSALSFEYAWQRSHSARLCKGPMQDFANVRGLGTRSSVRRKLIALRVLLAECLPFRQFPLQVVFERPADYDFFHGMDRLKGLRAPGLLPAHIQTSLEPGGNGIKGAFEKNTDVFCSDNSVMTEAVPADDEHDELGGRDDDACVCVLCDRPVLPGRPMLTCPLTLKPEPEPPRVVVLDDSDDPDDSDDDAQFVSLDLDDRDPDDDREGSGDRNIDGNGGGPAAQDCEPCPLVAHPVCLAQELLQGQRQVALIPKGGDCPICEHEIAWPQLVRDSKTVRGVKTVS